jgi:starch synthase
MKKKKKENLKVLFIFQEISPFVEETERSLIGHMLPRKVQEKGGEIRTFMPSYGIINERKNQLHEVIRLSGTNIVINDNDNPLIIKVSSIPLARMQIYFIDNDDYFVDRAMLYDENGNFYSDNDERALFFTKGVLETVKKLRWIPDIIHVAGWIGHLFPLYIKQVYKDEPYFQNAKVVYTLYNDKFEGDLDKKYKDKLKFDNIPSSTLKILSPSNYINTIKLALNYADGVSYFEDGIDEEITKYIEKLKIPFLGKMDINNENYADEYIEFYKKLLSEEYIKA